MIAVVGETTESIGAARNGMENWYASMVQATETSSGSRVRRPISISILTGSVYGAALAE